MVIMQIDRGDGEELEYSSKLDTLQGTKSLQEKWS